MARRMVFTVTSGGVLELGQGGINESSCTDRNAWVSSLVAGLCVGIRYIQDLKNVYNVTEMAVINSRAQQRSGVDFGEGELEGKSFRQK